MSAAGGRAPGVVADGADVMGGRWCGADGAGRAGRRRAALAAAFCVPRCSLPRAKAPPPQPPSLFLAAPVKLIVPKVAVRPKKSKRFTHWRNWVGKEEEQQRDGRNWWRGGGRIRLLENACVSCACVCMFCSYVCIASGTGSPRRRAAACRFKAAPVWGGGRGRRSVGWMHTFVCAPLL